MLRDALRAAGWRSEIFAEAIHDDLAAEAVQALDVPRARGRGRRRHLPVHDVVGRGRLPGRARVAADPGLPQLHRARVLRRLGAAQRGAGRHGRPRSWTCWRPEALLGLAKSRFSEAELRRAGCRRTAVVPVLADYGRVTAHARPAGGGRAGPAARRRRRRHPLRRADRALQGAARAGQGAVGLPPPLRRRGPACISSGARRASSTPRRCWGSSTTSG